VPPRRVTLRWDENGTGVGFRLERGIASRNPNERWHDHDFVEVFWVESGTVRHDINGRTVNVEPGTAVFISAGDAHRVLGEGEARVCSCAIPQATEASLRERYGGEVDPWPWGDGPLPTALALPQDALSALAYEAETLAARGAPPITVDRFLLGLLDLVAARRMDIPGPMPEWLAEALRRIRLNPVLREGVPALVALSGRSSVHLERCVRRYLGCTPTVLVNRYRVEYAVKLLRHRRMTAGAVAAAVGLANLGHFYKVFRAHMGVPPGRFRTHAGHPSPSAVPDMAFRRLDGEDPATVPRQ
jgi:AraC family cel operon transcriptional repressor